MSVQLCDVVTVTAITLFWTRIASIPVNILAQPQDADSFCKLRFVRRISQNCEKLPLASCCLSVRPHGTTERVLMKFYI